jgi:pyruvate dehydrogenase E1 component beta subunit
MRMNQAITRAIADEMEQDSRVVVFGEDVAVAEGPFKTSEGLLATFGPDRVRDTPISETGFLGAAVGAAMTGLRPVTEIMFIEFLGVAFDQVVTEAALMHYLSAGRFNVPMVVRASAGSGLGFGCQHSQTLERWMLGTPGLKLAVASGARTAYGLTRAAIRDNNPVVLLEPRALYGEREDVEPGEASIIELGTAEKLRDGTDVTVVALGQTVQVAMAAEALASWSGEVLDLRSLMPWDKEAIVASAKRTGRLVIVEENQFTGGWGTEIASYVSSTAFSDLKAPVVRVTAPDVPVPFGQELEKRFLPSPEYVVQQVDELLATNSAPAPWWKEFA